MIRPRWHGPTIIGRLRSDTALLVLMALVVALTTMLTAVVAPLSDRAADRTLAGAVRDAGPDAAVVATSPRERDAAFTRTRDPRSVEELRAATNDAASQLPARLAAILDPGVTTVTAALQLLDAGPGRSLQLTFLDTPSGPPAVTYVAGGPPQGSVGADAAHVTLKPDAPPWPVQVALSRAVAQALGVGPGDRLPAQDDQRHPVRLLISGVYVATDRQSPGWRLAPDLLDPTRVVSEGIERIAGGALVSAASLPDLRLALPPEELAHHISFLPRPSLTRWSDVDALTRDVARLQVSVDATASGLSWDSRLGRVLVDARTRVATAQGQAQVILVGMIVCALLVLGLAAQLLVGRRAGPVTIAREHGASLATIALELLVEALLVAALGAALGLGGARLLVGGVGWTWSVPVLVVAAASAPLYGAVLAGRSTNPRRIPANRSARRTLDRARRARRLAVELGVVATAALCLVALRQRGVVHDGGWASLTPSAAATACAAAGTVIAARMLAPTLRLSLRGARRSVGGVRLLIAARLNQTATRVLPLLVVSVAVAQLTLGVALAATEHRGQEAGALLAVGADARLTTTPSAQTQAVAARLAGSPGVRAVATGRVADDVQVLARGSAATVRLVVVDATAYRRLLATSSLPDAPQLARLREADRSGRLPALMLGGSEDLREDPVLRWQDTNISLDVVGTAPAVGAAIDPVVVVDAAALARTGVDAAPDTLWAVGPGAATALEHQAGPSGSVLTYAEELKVRQHAPLASALVRLAAASCVPLLLFAILGVVLAAAAEAPSRGQALGRLRALGLDERDLRLVLVGELVTTVLLAALTGLALGLASVFATFGSLSLERITGQTLSPHLVVPWWILLAAVAVVGSALVVALAEWRRLRRSALAVLLRS